MLLILLVSVIKFTLLDRLSYKYTQLECKNGTFLNNNEFDKLDTRCDLLGRCVRYILTYFFSSKVIFLSRNGVLDGSAPNRP